MRCTPFAVYTYFKKLILETDLNRRHLEVFPNSPPWLKGQKFLRFAFNSLAVFHSSEMGKKMIKTTLLEDDNCFEQTDTAILKTWWCCVFRNEYWNRYRQSQTPVHFLLLDICRMLFTTSSYFLLFWGKEAYLQIQNWGTNHVSLNKLIDSPSSHLFIHFKFKTNSDGLKAWTGT